MMKHVTTPRMDRSGYTIILLSYPSTASRANTKNTPPALHIYTLYPVHRSIQAAMASSVGYAVIPAAISLSLIQRAVSAIASGLKVKRETEKYTEYEVPPICINIRDEFINVSRVYIG
jgi:hypothetical protein